MSQPSIPESTNHGSNDAPVLSGHTPTPWKIGSNDWLSHSCCFDAAVVGYREGSCVSVVEAHSVADAAFIVRAVNSHEALVKALEFIRDGYDNQDVNHVDFRVKAYQVALDALTSSREVQP